MVNNLKGQGEYQFGTICTYCKGGGCSKGDGYCLPWNSRFIQRTQATQATACILYRVPLNGLCSPAQVPYSNLEPVTGLAPIAAHLAAPYEACAPVLWPSVYRCCTVQAVQSPRLGYYPIRTLAAQNYLGIQTRTNQITLGGPVSDPDRV